MSARPCISLRRAIEVSVVVAAAGAAGCEKSPSRGPAGSREARAATLNIRNVVLVSIDTLRADHLGCYGHPLVQSPAVDAIAKEGVLFEQHVVPAPSTLASHTSLMTGTYPHTHGVPKNGHAIGDANVMLAEVLRDAGFRTAAFIGAFPLDSAFHFDQGFEHFNAKYDLAAAEDVRDQTQRRAENVTDAVIAWLNERATGRKSATDPTERLFLFVHYFDVHWPYDAPAPYGRMYRRDSSREDGSMAAIRRAQRHLRGPQRDEGLELARILDAEYSAEVTYCDAHIGRLFEALKTHGLFDDSLIVVTSDHGETMHEHFNPFNHGQSVFETEIRAPLIIRFPGGRFGGRRVDRLASSIDVMPSILEWLGLPRPERTEGQSFAAIINGPLPARAPVFAEATQPWWRVRFHHDATWPNRDKYQCVRTERYKYMLRVPDERFELYDLVNDPGEQTNLLEGTQPYDKALAASLRDTLEEWRAQAAPIHAEAVNVPEAIRKLESLGYVGDTDD